MKTEDKFGGKSGLPADVDRLTAALCFLFCLAGTFLPLSVVFVGTVPARAGGLALQEAALSRRLVASAFCWCCCLFLLKTKTLKTLLSMRTDIILSASAGCAVVACCMVEAVTGLLQVCGLEQSNHALFPLTGTFPNPGPFAGFVAAGIPVALHGCLSKPFFSGNCENPCQRLGGFLENGYSIVVWLSLMLMCGVLPVSMSRSAWIAAVVSGLFVAWIDCGWKGKAKLYFMHHKSRSRVILAVGSAVILLLCAGLFFLKLDSAIGRVFMWRMSLLAIFRKPLTGHGRGSFAAAYGDAQESYFASGAGTPKEIIVADCPGTAFNEYLQLAVEWGLPALVVLILLLFVVLKVGLRQKRTGLCGSLIALMVFAFSSYPMQFPAFWGLSAVAVTGCLLSAKRMICMVLAAASSVTGGLLWESAEKIVAVSLPWSQTKTLYQSEAYGLAVEGYEELYPVLQGYPDFMFEYGHALHRMGRYETSNNVLYEAERLSCDPMILNIIGKNLKGMGHYAEAERYYIRSTRRVPGRMYPWYLLVLLYDEWLEKIADDADYPYGGQLSQNNHEVHLSREEILHSLYHSAQHLLSMDVKVQSPAVMEMQEKVGDILERHEN